MAPPGQSRWREPPCSVGNIPLPVHLYEIEIVIPQVTCLRRMSGHIQVHESTKSKHHVQDGEGVGAYGLVRSRVGIIDRLEYGLVEIGLIYGGIPGCMLRNKSFWVTHNVHPSRMSVVNIAEPSKCELMHCEGGVENEPLGHRRSGQKIKKVLANISSCLADICRKWKRICDPGNVCRHRRHCVWWFSLISRTRFILRQLVNGQA
jgi:hypothetical protein